MTQLLICPGQERLYTLEFRTTQRNLTHETFLDIGLWLETRQELLLLYVCLGHVGLWFCIHSKDYPTTSQPLTAPSRLRRRRGFGRPFPLPPDTSLTAPRSPRLRRRRGASLTAPLPFGPRYTRPTSIEYANRRRTPVEQQFHTGRTREEKQHLYHQHQPYNL